MKPGIYSGLSFEQYLSIEAVNKSSLDDARLSPAHYFARHIDPNREPRKATRPMKLGTDIHAAILEPERFARDYIVIPADAPKRPTKAQLEAKKPSDETVELIEWWRQFDEKATGKTQISAEDFDTCSKIQKVFRSHPACRELLKPGGKSEITLVWIDPETGVKCKARLDWMPVAGYLLDVKSVECAHEEDFGRKAYDYDWHVQAAWYLDGWKVLTGDDRIFVFAAIEKTAPFAPAFFHATEEDVSRGRRKYRPILRKLAAALQSGDWTGYETGIRPLKAPSWEVKRDEEATPEQF